MSSRSLRRQAAPLLARATAWAAGRDVVVPEYALRPRARYGWDGQPPIRALQDLLDDWVADHRDDVVTELAALEEWCAAVPKHTDGTAACWENDYWGNLDAVWQVASLRRRNPATYIEIGSGYSTLFARRAIETFGLRTRIVSIDPEPRQAVDAACDVAIRSTLEATDLSVFADLGPGDVVLMDGSHVATMNSDTVVFFLEVLPQLAGGVLVGVDDVYLPWDYHPSWTGRWYGEQYLLATYLLGGSDGDTIVFPGWAATKALASEPRLEPLWRHVENHFGRLGSSFWLERRTP